MASNGRARKDWKGGRRKSRRRIEDLFPITDRWPNDHENNIVILIGFGVNILSTTLLVEFYALEDCVA